MEGVLPQLSVHVFENGHKLILKNALEILIPQVERECLIEKLHSAHLSDEGMKMLHRKKFWWPKISLDLEKKYKSSKPCLEDSICKVQKKVVVAPEDLTLLAPREEFNLDFAVFGNKKYIIIKDKMLGVFGCQRSKESNYS